MKDGLYSLKDTEKLTLKEVHRLHSKYINSSQYKILKKFSFGNDIFTKAKGMYLYTDKKKILDFSGGIGVLNHGHNNQKVLNSRINFQKKNKMEVHKIFFSQYTVALANNISKILSKNLTKSFFCNSGAESVEGSIKIAHKFHKGTRKYIAHSNISFHGKTIFSGNISGSLNNNPFPEFKNKLAFEFSNINSLDRLIKKYRKKNNESNIYAIIIETFNNNLLRECSYEFIKYLRYITKKNKIILIFDEVYTGWGKTGYFFHYKKYKNIEPDIICLSKSMGGGKSSISAYVVNEYIYKKTYENTNDAFLHTSTYNGFGEECATAIEAINILIEDKLVENSYLQGNYLKSELNKLKKNYTCIDDIRGIGCIQGIVINLGNNKSIKNLIGEFPLLKNKISLLKKLPAAAVSNFLYKNFNIFTVLNDNKDSTILYVAPSLIVNKKEIDYFISSLKKTLDKGIIKLITSLLFKIL